jgi:hypothetical protein
MYVARQMESVFVRSFDRDSIDDLRRVSKQSLIDKRITAIIDLLTKF